jgi:hypothetical protein
VLFIILLLFINTPSPFFFFQLTAWSTLLTPPRWHSQPSHEGRSRRSSASWTWPLQAPRPCPMTYREKKHRRRVRKSIFSQLIQNSRRGKKEKKKKKKGEVGGGGEGDECTCWESNAVRESRRPVCHPPWWWVAWPGSEGDGRRMRCAPSAGPPAQNSWPSRRPRRPMTQDAG